MPNDMQGVGIPTQDFPQEPSVQELVEQETKELNMQNQDLVMKLIQMENENNFLKKELENQAAYFDRTLSKLVIRLLGE